MYISQLKQMIRIKQKATQHNRNIYEILKKKIVFKSFIQVFFYKKVNFIDFQ